MIDAEMYGITFSEKMAMRCTAPPENMLNMPRMPAECVLNSAANCWESMPGIGI